MVGTTKAKSLIIVRWLVVGANGMLGQDFISELRFQNIKIIEKPKFDIANIDEVRSNIQEVDVVVNCAAYTAVDDAESNQELASRINSDGPKNLAIVCREITAKLVHFSTDYVFSGNSEIPYDEQEIPDPKSVYGRSKLAGEQEVQKILPENHYIIRTAWLYGKHGKHFGKTVLNLAKTHNSLSVVNDQIGQPTWTKDLAKKSIEIVTNLAPTGIYHGTSSGQTSWFEYAQNIFELAGLDISRIEPVSSCAYPRPASRPHFSVLGHKAFELSGIAPIRHWRDALQESFNNGVFSD